MRRAGLCLAGGVLALVVVGQTPASAAGGCAVLEVRSTGGSSTVYRVELPGDMRELGGLPYRVDAVGYSRRQDLVYGVTSGGRAIVLRQDGRVRDLGKLPGVPAGAEAGAVDGDRWYLRADNRLYTVDIDPGSRTYLRRVAVRTLSPRRFADVGDFAAGPDGRLRGVVVSAKGDVITVAADPSTGSVVPQPRSQFPASRSFDSVVADAGTLYATTREPGGRGGWYRAGADSVDEVATAPGATDAAGCLAAPNPEAPNPEAPQPMRPPMPPRSTPPTAEPETPDSPRAPAHMPPPKPSPRAVEKQQEEQEKADATATKRRWGLTALLLILGAGAVHRGR